MLPPLMSACSFRVYRQMLLCYGHQRTWTRRPVDFGDIMFSSRSSFWCIVGISSPPLWLMHSHPCYTLVAKTVWENDQKRWTFFQLMMIGGEYVREALRIAHRIKTHGESDDDRTKDTHLPRHSSQPCCSRPSPSSPPSFLPPSLARRATLLRRPLQHRQLASVHACCNASVKHQLALVVLACECPHKSYS